MCEEHEQLYHQDESTDAHTGEHSDDTTGSVSIPTSSQGKKKLLSPPIIRPPPSPASTTFAVAGSVYSASFEALNASLAGAASVAPYQRMQFDTKATVDPDAFNSLWYSIPVSLIDN
jgi:hypothetical protein